MFLYPCYAQLSRTINKEIFMIRKLLVIVPMALSTAAFAADSGSEYFHQAAAGAWEVTPALDYHDYSVKWSTTTNKTDVSGLTYGVKGEYGINDMFSVGVGLSADSDTSKTDGSASTSKSGMNNIDIYGLGKYDLGGSLLRYGLDFAISTAKVKTDNVDLGTTFLTPFVGWEMAMGPGIFGLKFSYAFQLTDRSFDTSSAKEKGINAESLSAFYEWQADTNWSLGLSLAWNAVNGSKVDGTQTDNGHAGMFVDVYAPITVADNITLIPNVGWGDDGTLMPISTGGLKTIQKWNVGVGARFAF